MRRIVSLLPSATEIVWTLGFGKSLVGRSHECDFPPQARSLPVCTKPRVNVNAASGEIDREVKALLREAISIYEIDTEAIRALKPDLILTQAQCEVCAVSLAEVEAAVREWADSRPRVLSLSPMCLAEVWDTIQSVADALEASERGVELLQNLRGRVQDTQIFGGRHTVACLEWLDPLMAAGNWVPELVELAGGKDLFGKPGEHSGWIEWNALESLDPERIILMPCGFDLQHTQRESLLLQKKPEWRELRAVKTGQVFATDGNAFFNRPGPRLVESFEILVEILHPEQKRFGHRGRGWEILQ